MADTTTPGATAPTPQTPSIDIHLLQSAIRNIDGQAREGLGNIGAVAYLAMRWLETPDAHRGSGSILHTVLGLIQERADNCLDLIGNAADSVGCSTPDEHRMRCWAAVKAARDGVSDPHLHTRLPTLAEDIAAMCKRWSIKPQAEKSRDSTTSQIVGRHDG